MTEEYQNGNEFSQKDERLLSLAGELESFYHPAPEVPEDVRERITRKAVEAYDSHFRDQE